MENEQQEKEQNEEPNTSDAGAEIIRLLSEILSQTEVTTNVINLANISVPNSITILKVKGSGKVSEVAISSTVNTFSIYIKADGKELFNKNSDFTTLSNLHPITNSIDADDNGVINWIVVRDISFTKDILIQMTSDSQITAKSIFCKYDIETQPEEDKIRKECKA